MSNSLAVIIGSILKKRLNVDSLRRLGNVIELVPFAVPSEKKWNKVFNLHNKFYGAELETLV